MKKSFTVMGSFKLPVVNSFLNVHKFFFEKYVFWAFELQDYFNLVF